MPYCIHQNSRLHHHPWHWEFLKRPYCNIYRCHRTCDREQRYSYTGKEYKLCSHNGTDGMVAAYRESPLSPDYCRSGANGFQAEEEDMTSMPSLVVFSGGTAFNSVAGHLQQLTTRVAHVLPVSDDGGSTAEIVRVLGGPAVGDIRSRCLRLADDTNEEAEAVRRLLAHRLPGDSSSAAKLEWNDIVEGEQCLWQGVSEPYKHTIRAFLVYFHTQIQRQATERFNFRNGSVGNFFFAGARLFFRSLEAAIFLFSRVTRIPEGSLVLPAIRTEGSITLGAELLDGSIIRGQNQISHPSVQGLEGQLAAPTHVDKEGIGEPLPSPIKRILYLASQGMGQDSEELLPPNPNVIHQLENADAIVYGIGSLYTSICPSLILEGVGEAICRREVPKVLLLNGSHDRETSAALYHGGLMAATDVVKAICSALNRDYGRLAAELQNPPSAYITAVLVPKGGEIAVDAGSLSALGVRHIVEVASQVDKQSGKVQFDSSALVDALQTVVSTPELPNVHTNP